MWVCRVSGNRWWGPTQLSSIIHYPVTNQITRWNNSSSHYRQRPLSEVTARPTWYSIYIIQPEVFKLLTCASGEKCCKGRIKTLDQVSLPNLFIHPPTHPRVFGSFGRTKGEIRVEKTIFGVIWIGFEGSCLGISHPPTHIWEKSPPKKLFLCWGLP